MPSPFDEWPEDRRLVGIGVEVDLLVWVPAVEIRRHVAGDGDEGNGVERGGGDAGDRVHETGTDVHEQDAGLAAGTCVSVSGVRRRLLVTGDHEVDADLL